MGDLPDYRSQMLPSFSVVCMDLFGPQEIRDDVVKKGPRKYKKVWGVIYTCTSTRAVQLDVATDYSTEAVLHTVRRLMAARNFVIIFFRSYGIFEWHGVSFKSMFNVFLYFLVLFKRSKTIQDIICISAKF